MSRPTGARGLKFLKLLLKNNLKESRPTGARGLKFMKDRKRGFEKMCHVP